MASGVRPGPSTQRSVPGGGSNVPVTCQTGATGNGDGAALNVSPYVIVVLMVSGLGSATINFEASVDSGATWFAVEAINVSTAGSSTTTTSNGLFAIPTPALGQVRARISNYVSGTISVAGLASSTSSALNIASAISANVTQGAGGGSANAWAINIWQGSNQASVVAVNAALAENVGHWLQTAAVMHGLDPAAGAGSQAVQAQVESTAHPNIRTSVWNGSAEQPAGDAAARAIHVTQDAQATGGATSPATMIRNVNATVQVVKNAAGTLYGLLIENTQANGTPAYVQVFDKAAPVLGTDVPKLEIPVSGAVTPVFVPVSLPQPGLSFGTAIALASTTTSAGAVGSANGVHVTPLYA